MSTNDIVSDLTELGAARREAARITPLEALKMLTVLEIRDDGAVVIGPHGWRIAQQVIKQS